jgi:F-type H+-transporting ATPase subunit delta
VAASGRAAERTLAETWCEAVFRIAAGRGVEDELLEEWRGIVALLDRDPQLESVFTSPLVSGEEKRQLIEKGFRGKASDLFVDTLQVLRGKGRLGLVRSVAQAFHAAWMERKGLVEAHVTSAVPLSPELRQDLTKVLNGLTRKETQLVEEVDPDILGGLVVRVGDRKFDDSVSRELELLIAAFATRGSRELQRIQEYIHNSEASSSRGV